MQRKGTKIGTGNNTNTGSLVTPTDQTTSNRTPYTQHQSDTLIPSARSLSKNHSLRYDET